MLHLHCAGTAAADLAALPPHRVSWTQFWDVAPGPAPGLSGLLTKARSNSLHPGAGVADLAAFLAALPGGTSLAVETPVAAEAGLPAGEPLRVAAEAASGFLSHWAEGGAG